MIRWQRKLELDDRTPGPINNRRGHRTLPLPQWLAGAFAVQLDQWPARERVAVHQPAPLNHGREPWL